MAKRMALVMAAGKGVRMKSELPKVLIPVCGRPMIQYVLDALGAAGIGDIVVIVGYRAELVRAELGGRAGLRLVQQREQLGTGHAVMMCREVLAAHDGPVFVIAGDSPMIEAESVERLLDDYDREPAACILGTALKDNPAGLGRIVRDAEGRFAGIVEDRDATEEQKRITEVNMSYYVFRPAELLAALDEIRPNNTQGEYYLTDVPGVLRTRGLPVRALPVLKPREVLGVNTVEELKAVEAAIQDGR